MIRCSSGLKLLESDLYSTLANEELGTGVCFSRRALLQGNKRRQLFLMQTLQPMRARTALAERILISENQRNVV